MKIICIGRNYVDHAKELSNPLPSEPLFFLKPDSSVLQHRHAFYIPEWTNDVHFEVELIYKIDRLGKHIDQKFAHKYYSGVSLGIDFTARDIQQQCKEKGQPWEKAKAFDGSAVVSRVNIPLTKLPDPKNIRFELRKNGQTVQSGNSSDMIFPIDKIIAFTSQYMMLKMGDIIFTGTPAGVGQVAVGDKLEGYLEGTKMFEVNIR